MKFVTREALLSREAKISKVMLNEEEFVFVREMSGVDRSILESSMMKFKHGGDLSSITSEEDIIMDPFNLKAKYACMCLCDEQGNLLFSIDDAEQFGKAITAHELDIIIEEADKLNFFMKKAKEETVKN